MENIKEEKTEVCECEASEETEAESGKICTVCSTIQDYISEHQDTIIKVLKWACVAVAAALIAVAAVCLVKFLSKDKD